MAAALSLATPSDESQILELMREFYAAEHLPFVEEVARRALRQLLESHVYGLVVLMRERDRLAGYLVLTFGFSLEFHGRDALVDEVYVRAVHRAQGLGRASLEFVERLCRDEGIHALHLEVDRANHRARALYNRAGYGDHDRYLLTKWLSEPPRPTPPDE
jgi:GNAT superfamily N-acetyltransferase